MLYTVRQKPFLPRKNIDEQWIRTTSLHFLFCLKRVPNENLRLGAFILHF